MLCAHERINERLAQARQELHEQLKETMRERHHDHGEHE